MDRFLARDVSLSLLPPFNGRTVTWTCAGPVHVANIFVSSYVRHSCHVWRILFPWCLPSPVAFTVISWPLPYNSLSPEVRGFLKTSYLEVSMPKSLTVHIVSCCSPCVCSHSLQEKTSRVMAEQGTDLVFL